MTTLTAHPFAARSLYEANIISVFAPKNVVQVKSKNSFHSAARLQFIYIPVT